MGKYSSLLHHFFLYLGQAVADAYGMLIKFDVNFIKKMTKKEQVKRILYGIYTITWQTIIMPYHIHPIYRMETCFVSKENASMYISEDYKFNTESLSPFINYRS